jgi:hypothetical protein
MRWLLAVTVVLAAAGWAVLRSGWSGLRAEFERDAREARARLAPAPAPRIVGEADLAPLPEPVRRYLRAAGVVGQPYPASYTIRFRGRIRGAPEERWMPFVAEQRSFVREPTRLFFLRATARGVPIHVYHRLAGGHASMRVKPLGLFTAVDAAGPVMDRSEAVTLLNDLCFAAPAALLEPTIAWEPLDARTCRARFTNGGQVVGATLFFDEEGLLVDFVSDDRSRASADGRTFTRLRWSTPLRDYRRFGPHRLAGRGDARWLLPGGGEFTYGEFEVVDVSYAPAGE